MAISEEIIIKNVIALSSLNNQKKGDYKGGCKEIFIIKFVNFL